MISRHFVLGPLLGVLLFMATASTAQPPPPPETKYAGRTLTEALLDLEARGLDILFTSQVVRPEMRVDAEPAGGSPGGGQTRESLRETLDQLLAPHGLQARAGPGGKLVVVPGRPAAPVVGPSGVRGTVRERGTARPLANIQILIEGAGIETITDAGGRFTLSDVPPGTHSLVARRPGFVVEQLSPVTVTAGHVTEVHFELVPAPLSLDEIVVTPSLISLLRSEPAARIGLDRDEIVALPHLGDDLFRALTLLPGTAGNEFSAQINIRGGRTDEVLVMLDQLELFDPYHIKDFGSTLSFIAPQAIAEVDLILGGFPAPFGDRMGGVLDMRTVEPAEGYGHLGLSIVTAQAGGAGRLREGRGDWLAVARYGSLELAEDFVSAEVQPSYWDVFGKVEIPLGDKQRLGMRLLSADDRLNTDVTEDLDRERVNTSYRSSYLWLTHRAFPSSKLFFDSVLSRGQIDRDRTAIETVEEELEFLVDDVRELDVTAFKQDWNLQLADRHYLRWGFDVRRLDADYDYANAVKPDESLDELRDGEALADVEFLESFRGEQYSVYLSERLKLFEKLTAELGLRYDEHTVPGDQDLSPRVNLVAPLGEASNLRLAWGHYFQSQRLYELQVEDGETLFFSSERTEQFGLGFEHLFEQGSTLRLDLYHRDITNPRPRYENLYEPVDSFPEVQPDRVRIAGDRARSRGAEIFLRGPRGGRIEWWFNYTYARVEDEIDGRDVPRGFDQPHTLNVDLNYRINEDWSINLAWRYHTGWPTTAVRGTLEEDDEGELEPVLTFGPINGERLSDYHRLDLRASRRWSLKKGELALFIDVQNLYNRENLAGFDVEFEVEEGEDGEVRVVAVEEVWAGILPSFGIDWKF